jgi:perosamine synthetase
MREDIKLQITLMSVPVNASIREAMQRIDDGGLGTAFLSDTETGRFAGLVTDGDIRRALLSGYGLESDVGSIPRPKARVGRVNMNPEEITSLMSDPVRVLPLLNDEGFVVDLSTFDRRVRIPVAEPMLGEAELLYVSECVLTGWVSSIGKFVNRFEEAFAEHCGTRHAIAVSNGTTALHLALLALDVGPGDEVIVPSLTFIATANAVSYTGATPVFVDSEPETWNIDPEAVKSALTPRTKAIIPVHLYGHPANLEPLLEIGERHGIGIVEDAAEAQGARYHGRQVGGIGDLGVFSFFGNKIITTGEGGMIVTNRDDLVEKIRVLRDHGMDPQRRYWHCVLGYNYRMTNIQAALGVGQMERLERILAAKSRIAQQYEAGLHMLPGLSLPPNAPWAEPVCWLYSVLINEEGFGADRDTLMGELKARNVDTRPLFIPIHQQPIYDTRQFLPNAERLSREGLSLPSSSNLASRDVDRVVAAIRKIYQEQSGCVAAV